MQIANLWHPGLRIIEFGAAQGALGDALVRAGYHHYLAVARSRRAMSRLACESPRLQSRLTVAGRGAVRRNNGEVLILDGWHGLHLARFRSVRHAQYVALRAAPRPVTLLALVAGLVQWLLGRVARPLVVEVSAETGKSHRLIAFGVRRRHVPGARRYVPHALGIERFLRRLNRQRVRYAVLRWFESLPVLPAGEDLDILVDDADLPVVAAMLDEGPGLQPVDLYSVTGLPGADYRRMPYFPPYLAQQILDRAIPRHELCWIPSRRDHFLSLAYHALYHKGDRSGLPRQQGAAPANHRPEHDYPGILRQMARQFECDAPITLDDLDAYLDRQGWRPPHDMLTRLARSNRWLRTRLADATGADEDHGLCVFVLRAQAFERGGVERAVALIERQGFSVLQTLTIDDAQRAQVGRSIRGGNWGPGPWPVSGGLPAAAIVAYDLDPQPPTRAQRKRFPFLSNARLLCKDRIRDAFNENHAPHQHCNVVHSSDNGREARDYLRVIAPELIGDVLARAAQLREQFQTHEPVLATRTRAGRRAKIEVVRWHGRLAVKKTFKLHQERFCQREASALDALSAVVPEVPPLLERGDSWLLLPYYDDVLAYQRSSGKLLPLAVAKQAIAALAKVYEAGFALVDASIDNLLVDRHEGLKLIDFEFCHPYEQKPPSFAASYDVVGCPADFSGEQPIQGGNSYDRNWRPYIGLSLHALLHDPTWLQHAKRGVYFATHAYRFVPRLVRHSVRRWLLRSGPSPLLPPAKNESAALPLDGATPHRRKAA